MDDIDKAIALLDQISEKLEKRPRGVTFWEAVSIIALATLGGMTVAAWVLAWYGA